MISKADLPALLLHVVSSTGSYSKSGIRIRTEYIIYDQKYTGLLETLITLAISFQLCLPYEVLSS